MESIKPAKLNKVSHAGRKIHPETFENRLSKMIDTLKVRAEREVCEYGTFKTVSENIKSKNKSDIIQEIHLQVIPLPKSLKENTPNFEKLRYLELTGTGNKGQKESVILARGTKDEIMKKLNDINFSEKVQNEIDEFKISFLED